MNLFTMQDKELMNAIHDDILIRQKDLIHSIITRAFIAKQNHLDFGSGGSKLQNADGLYLETDYDSLCQTATSMLLVVEELWKSCNYSYKTEELKQQILKVYEL